MRQRKYFLTAVGLLGLAGLCGCSRDGGPPRAGDRVAPVLAGGLHWKAGERGAISVRLEARNKDGSPARSLGFDGIPAEADPLATIIFYHDDEPRPPVAVTFSHRC